MRPNSNKADIPTTHAVTSYIHNQFVEFIDKLKETIQVSSTISYISVNMLMKARILRLGECR
jgi:hypothetical protein